MHNGWAIIDAETKEQARMVLPPPMRAQAKITALNHFTLEQINPLTGEHTA